MVIPVGHRNIADTNEQYFFFILCVRRILYEETLFFLSLLFITFGNLFIYFLTNELFRTRLNNQVF